VRTRRYLVLAALASVSGAACARRGADLNSEIARLRSITTPATGKLLRASPIERTPYAVQATWEIDPGQPWANYRQTLTALSGCRETAPATNRLEYWCRLGEEAYYVRLRGQLIGGQTLIQVSFNAYRP
jgi:hypothetical protein